MFITIYMYKMCEKTPKSNFSDLDKIHFVRIKQTYLLTVHYYPSYAVLCQNRLNFAQ